MLRILLTNDDGIYSRGLTILARTLQEIAHVYIVAPDRDRSGASNSLTLRVPLRVKNLENNRFSVEGTPTDCIHVGITSLLEEVPDMIVSGINSGPNLGDDIWYSGTVAGAMEGRFLGLPAIAVSLVGEHLNYYATAARVVQKIIDRIIANPLPAKTILNVNVPDLPYAELAGYAVTRLGARHGAEPTIRQLDPRGQPIYWIGPPGEEQDAGPGTDFYAIKEKKVSVTPLHIDLTHYSVLDQLGTCLSDM